MQWTTYQAATDRRKKAKNVLVMIMTGARLQNYTCRTAYALTVQVLLDQAHFGDKFTCIYMRKNSPVTG